MESTASGPVQSPVLDRRHARSRRGRSAGHGGLLRPLWYHQIVLLLATDAPPIRRVAWATLQEWAVCSSIFVVGRGVKAGLPGSTLRDTLNARSKRVARSRRPSGRRTAYICAASSAAALAVPQSHSVVSGRRRAHTSMEKTATAAQSRRRPRGVHALVSSVRWCRARVASLAVARTTSCRASGTVLAAQHSCVGRWDRISIDQITPATRYVSL